ncbi:uncharacterized protein LOC132182041 [Corylus avellana]|uniref:uncharacterized protein LOC132182041 n=1 Tax=Corylus avellana TaxID=13451 RepID=UPI00286A273E|nr:uncharacterized protein LOC132182041 [Corylus avellana]
MVVKSNEDGVLTGVPTSKRGLRISHIFFVDDSLLFCKASMVEWHSLTEVLRRYELASGQHLNTNKTSIYFSSNTLTESKVAILEEAGIPATQRYDTYLGLPALVGKSRTAAFRGIIDRVRKRLQDWKLKFLSQAGKEILLKAVIHAIPTYCMSIFLLPKALCVEINTYIRKFWWGQYGKEDGINWMSWSRMGNSKSSGGMGFCNFTCFNKAILAKQSCRLWNNPDSLVAQVMKGKYYSDTSVLEAIVGRRPSFAWHSIHSSCALLQEGSMWRVGNGSTIRIWKDLWLPINSTGRMSSPPAILHPNATVSELLDGESKWWNYQLLASIFAPEVVQLILKIPSSCTNQPDTLI